MNEYDNDDYDTETDLDYEPESYGDGGDEVWDSGSPYKTDEDYFQGSMDDQLFDMMMEDRIGGTGVEDFGGE